MYVKLFVQLGLLFFLLVGLRVHQPNISVFGKTKHFFPGHFLKYDCMCYLHDVFSTLKYDYKLNLRYCEITYGHYQACCVLLSAQVTLLLQLVSAHCIRGGFWAAKVQKIKIIICLSV